MSTFPTYGLGDDDGCLRDIDGHLIRAEQVTLDELERELNIKVDGQKVPEVYAATLWIDDQGLVRRDLEGRPIPRRTTLLDAINKRYTPEADEAHPVPVADNPVSVLCHQEHLTPVAVCRVCSVLLSSKGKAEARLVPACKWPVQPNHEIHTSRSREIFRIAGREGEMAGDYVARTVRQIVDLIALDHLHELPGVERSYDNELLAISEEKTPPKPTWCEESGPIGRDLVSLLAKSGAKPVDDTSAVIRYDPASCILCDRCARSCHDVKPFAVISHTGRGHDARISFDLGASMGESGCVSCGECAISCPTGALSFRGTVYQDRDPWADQPVKPVTVKAEELRNHPLFAGVPFAFLKWNEGAVGRRELIEADVLCEKGHSGSTAFVIEQGTLAIDRGPGTEPLERSTSAVIVGEMACMNNQARNATIRAAGPSRVLVVRRNILHMLRRNPIARAILEEGYAERALADWMVGGTLFDGLPADLRRRIAAFLNSRPPGDVTFVRVDPKQVFLREGELADSVFFLREGHVEISEMTTTGARRVRDYLGPGRSFGEIAVLSALSERVAGALPEALRGRRTGTCSALDHVELIRVSRDAIETLLESDTALRAELEGRCLEMIAKNRDTARSPDTHLRNEFTRQGLYEGQSLLSIDLQRCTRCLECVQACADSHQGDTRIVFEGERFGTYLIPKACRSCHDPLCLVGCPVDAIHRRPPDPKHPERPSRAIFIEDHCIGCGLCAHNCPFDSIQVYDRNKIEAKAAPKVASSARLALNCDLCESLDGVPRCVDACPHDAAMRNTGHHLMGLLELNMMGPAPVEPPAPPTPKRR
jgi:Fe-S-cluster-containing hydrogenase component 2/CRP-like cAMP-binding protein